jgi:hypothetical protein
MDMTKSYSYGLFINRNLSCCFYIAKKPVQVYFIFVFKHIYLFLPRSSSLTNGRRRDTRTIVWRDDDHNNNNYNNNIYKKKKKTTKDKRRRKTDKKEREQLGHDKSINEKKKRYNMNRGNQTKNKWTTNNRDSDIIKWKREREKKRCQNINIRRTF